MVNPEKHREALAQLFKSQYFMVLATKSVDELHTSLVSFTASHDLRWFYFITPKKSQKFLNLKKYPQVSLFVDNRSNKAEDIDEIREHANDNGLTFTILKDDKNIIADKFEASFTPEIYVLNNEFELLYHGRIDNSRRESEVDSNDLRDALEEILSGKAVSTPETKAFGCTIKRI